MSVESSAGGCSVDRHEILAFCFGAVWAQILHVAVVASLGALQPFR